MSELTTVYLVSSGDYSDYAIAGVFSTREKAEAFVATHFRHPYGDRPEIEEWILDPADLWPASGYAEYEVIIDEDGNGAKALRSSSMPVRFQEDQGHYSPGTYRGVHRPAPFFVFSVVAKDEDHAIKIANERRIARLAEGAA